MEEDTLASTRHLEDGALVESLHISCTTSASTAATHDRGQSAAVAALVADDCAESAAAELVERRQDEEVELQLLGLPDALLQLLARLMGRRARLLCSKLRQMYGPPGAVLTLSDPMPAPHASAPLPPTYACVLQSWRHPVRRLVLADDSRSGRGICFDAPLSLLVATALPHLLELQCDRLDLGSGGAEGPRHSAAALTALTSIDFKQDLHLGPHALCALSAHAPHLRLLRMRYRPARSVDLVRPHRFVPSGDALWSTLAALRCLRSADVPVRLPSSTLYTGMRALSALTHLGLVVMNAWTYPSAASLVRLAAALGALPALASVRLVDPPVLGPVLGAALRALPALRSVELLSTRGCVGFASDEDPPGACLPDISAMPRLERLALVGHGLLPPEQPHAGAFLPLRALELGAASAQQLRAACALAAACSALTRLVLRALDDVPSAAVGGDWAATGPLLGQALSRNPQLAHLDVDWGLGGFTPCLAGLRSLTCLALKGVVRGVDPCGVAMAATLAGLSSLRKLALRGTGDRRECLEAVRKLPQLEDMALWGAGWFEGHGRVLQQLLPPPERLTRLVLGASSWDVCVLQLRRRDAATGFPGFVEQLARYDVAVVQSSSLSDWQRVAKVERSC